MAIGLTPTKTTPLISFYTLVDEDVGLIAYVTDHYGDNDIFDIKSLEKYSSLQLIGELYRRKYKNPLYLIMKDEKYKDLLDRCYNEFLSEKEADILEYSVETEFTQLVEQFKKSGEVVPTIMYYNDAQLEVLNTIKELENISKVHVNDILNFNQFSQFYFKTFDEYYKFEKRIISTTIYVSTCGLNLNDTNDYINLDNDKIRELLRKDIRVSVFDLYRMKLIGEYNNDNN